MSSSLQIRKATPTDIPLLVHMMAEFYAESNYPLNHDEATRTFAALLEDPSHGAIWLTTLDDQPAGYIVLTLHFSMEHGGLCGHIEDLFVRPSSRRHGAARIALETLLTDCQMRGALAVQVETAPDNTAARALYESCGLELRPDERLTFTRPLTNSVTPSNSKPQPN